MTAAIFRYLNPRLLRRDRLMDQVERLRARDGESCRRCRRPMRFDLPIGHDLAPAIEQTSPTPRRGDPDLREAYLCHGRCNIPGRDHTEAALERLRPQREAELLSKGRRRAD